MACWLPLIWALASPIDAFGQSPDAPPRFPQPLPPMGLFDFQEDLPPAPPQDDIAPLRPEWPAESVVVEDRHEFEQESFDYIEYEPSPSRWGRFFHEAHASLTAFDPCYEPHWSHLANAALQVEPVRPQTQQRFRWDSGSNLVFPDRAEYFMARMGGGGLGLPTAEPSLHYDELTMYTEAAHGGFGAFSVVSYRAIDPASGIHHAGFGDISFGTKSLLHDSELAQLSFRFTTFVPSGQSFKGLGTGHVSMELALLFALNLTPTLYLQGEVGEWFPLGGDHAYAGALSHYHFSLNHDFGCDWSCHWKWIATLEVGGWSFQDGAFTDPVLGQGQRANGDTYVDLGPGLRIAFHDHLDFGFGVRNALTKAHWAETLYRTELRIRY